MVAQQHTNAHTTGRLNKYQFLICILLVRTKNLRIRPTVTFKFAAFLKTGGTLKKLGWVVSHDSRNPLPCSAQNM